MILIRQRYNKKDEDKKDFYKEGAVAGGLALGALLSKRPGKEMIEKIKKNQSSWINGKNNEDKEFIDRYKKSKFYKPYETITQDQKHAALAYNGYADGVMKSDVHLGPNSSRETIAHELGHGKDFLENGHKPKVLARVANCTKAGSMFMAGVGIGTGLRAGAKKVKDEDYEEEALSKYSGALTGAAIGAPTLAEEFRASRNGLKIMKELGYDKKAISKGRKNLLKAGLSYGGDVLKNMAIGQAAHAISKKGAEWVLKDEDNKKKD